MSSAAVSIEATYGDRQTLDALANLIGKRVERLGESSEQAATAASILILKSIRARTRVADPKKAGGVTVSRRPDLFVSFARVGGANRLCIRVGGKRGSQYSGKWRSAVKGIDFSRASVYFVRDKMARENVKDDYSTYVLIANSEDEARSYALDKQSKRIARYAGLAKNLLGSLMHKVSAEQAAATSANSLINAVIGKASSVAKTSSGYDSGSVSIVVRDLLRYAIPAVEGGASTINLAMQKASNTMAARINKLATSPFSEDVKIPFPEISS